MTTHDNKSGEKLEPHSSSDRHDHHSSDESQNVHIPKAMQIYEPWMEPDYYKKKQKKPKDTHEEHEPEQPVEETMPSINVADTGVPHVQPKTKISAMPDEIPDEDPSDFIAWVMNGRMDDIGDVEKKLFKNEKH